MKKAPAADKDLAALLDRLAQLENRVQQLEAEHAALVAAPPPIVAAPQESVPATAAPPAPPREELPEHVVLAISAAVAAYLGKRATVRQIRLIGNEAWAQQGRVSIMASHRWAMQRN